MLEKHTSLVGETMITVDFKNVQPLVLLLRYFSNYRWDVFGKFWSAIPTTDGKSSANFWSAICRLPPVI